MPLLVPLCVHLDTFTRQKSSAACNGLFSFPGTAADAEPLQVLLCRLVAGTVRDLRPQGRP